MKYETKHLTLNWAAVSHRGCENKSTDALVVAVRRAYRDQGRPLTLARFYISLDPPRQHLAHLVDTQTPTTHRKEKAQLVDQSNRNNRGPVCPSPSS